MRTNIFPWAGGKQRIIKHYLPHFPEGSIETYSEPFFGGGAMFAYVAERYDPKVAYLNDIKSDVMEIYISIQKHLSDFVTCLNEYEGAFLPLSATDRKTYYLELREANIQEREHWDLVRRAAVQHILLKTCYRAIWKDRRTDAGGFWASTGDVGRIRRLYDLKVLEYWNHILTNREVHLMSEDWSKVPVCDFTYYDPPYRQASADYDHSFRDSELQKLIELVETNSNVWLANWDLGDGFFEKTSACIQRFDVRHALNNPSQKTSREVLLAA